LQENSRTQTQPIGISCPAVLLALLMSTVMGMSLAVDESVPDLVTRVQSIESRMPALIQADDLALQNRRLSCEAITNVIGQYRNSHSGNV